MTKKKERILRKRTKVRSQIKTGEYRLSIHRSNRYLFAQIIEPKSGKTILGLSDKTTISQEGTKTQKAQAFGLKFAQEAGKKKIKEVVFDRGSFRYHGRLKAFAQGAREGGLVF